MKDYTKGQALVEILITIGLAAILLPALIVGVIASRGGRAQQDQHLQAVTQIQQIQEAMRSIRESGWTAIATDGTYHPVVSGSIWTLAAGNQTVNGYTDQVTISDVYRDTSGTIVSTGGTLDPATKQVTTKVSWSTPYPSSIQSVMYLTRYLSNFSHTDTTVTDFNKGTLSGTSVTNTSGGEVVMSGGGGNADWCTPQNSIINSLTLPKQGNTLYALPGGAYVGTGDGTQGVTFINIGISQPTPPASPSATVAGTYSSTYKTNDIFSDGRYVYLATDGSSSQVVILDLTQNPYTKIGWIDLPSKQPANGIYVDNNIAYITSSDQIYTYDVSVKTGDHTTPLGTAEVWKGLANSAEAEKIVERNGYIYIGASSALYGMQKFKVSNNSTTIQLVGVSDQTIKQSPQGIYVNSDGTRAYVAFNDGAGSHVAGFLIIDTSMADPPPFWQIPNYYPILGEYDTGAMNPSGMVVVPNTNRAIIVGNGGTQQYQVVDLSNESAPVLCGGLSISAGVNGVSSVVQANGDAYSYIISGEAKNQFKIIQGGSGGTYTNSGTYESAAFAATSSALFNNIYATIAQPANTNIKAQVAVAPSVNGNCTTTTYTYVGPNGDPSAYFTPTGATLSASLPFGSYGTNYQNPGRCFRYKFFFSSTNISQTAVLYDMSTNYSP